MTTLEIRLREDVRARMPGQSLDVLQHQAVAITRRLLDRRASVRI
jgi:hypothetical protein